MQFRCLVDAAHFCNKSCSSGGVTPSRLVLQVPPEFAQFYSEKIVFLPGSAFLGEFSSSRNHVIESEEQRQQALQDMGISSGSFVLGNFNRAFKLDPSAFAAWLEVFARVEDAVMLMFEWKDEPATISNIRRAAGPYKQRIHFAKLPPVDQRFASKGLAHVFLDTPLYNAHGTATEVISAGVPVVSHASNASLLSLYPSLYRPQSYASKPPQATALMPAASQRACCLPPAHPTP
jgi:hypothetical protein